MLQHSLIYIHRSDDAHQLLTTLLPSVFDVCYYSSHWYAYYMIAISCRLSYYICCFTGNHFVNGEVQDSEGWYVDRLQ